MADRSVQCHHSVVCLSPPYQISWTGPPDQRTDHGTGVSINCGLILWLLLSVQCHHSPRAWCLCCCGSMLWLTRSVHCHHRSLPPRQAWGLMSCPRHWRPGGGRSGQELFILHSGPPPGGGGPWAPAGRLDPVAGSRSGGGPGLRRGG